jgi:hypothetical protein
MELLNEHLPGGKVYGDRHEADDEEHDEPDREHDRERMREYLESKGTDESIISDVLEMMPRNAREGGMGGRVGEADDRRRRADDRHRRDARDRRMAADSSDSFNRMFPDAARIGLGAL